VVALDENTVTYTVEVEVTLSLYSDRVEIPELEATIYLDKVEKVSIVKGSELPLETMMIAGVVGLVIDKDKLLYVVVELKPSRSGILTTNSATTSTQNSQLLLYNLLLLLLMACC